MAKANEGDQLRISAASWNRHEAVADWYFRLKEFRDSALQNISSKHPGVIWIKNSSSADRRQGEILKVGDYLCTGLAFGQFGQYPWFDTAIHDGTDAPLAVLLQPIPNGEIGPAQITGVCPALVNIGTSGQKYARPASSNDVLQGSAIGPVQILYVTTGTGEKECMVNLSNGRFQAHGKADANIAKAASGAVSIWTGAGGSESDSTLNETCYARGVALTSGKIVQVALINNVFYAGCWES